MYAGEYIVFDGNDHVRPFVYLVVQKTGCSSVKKAISPLFGLEAPAGGTEVERVMSVHEAFKRSGHQIPHKEFVRNRRENRYRDHLKFAFVRHPLDRLVSCYLQKLSGEGAQGLSRYEFAGQVLYKGMPFKDFARAVCRIPDEASDAHFRSQHLTTHDAAGTPLADEICFFENLGRDFRKIAHRLNLPPTLPHLFRSARQPDHRTFYDDETRELVNRRYRRDMELFGYRAWGAAPKAGRTPVRGG